MGILSLVWISGSGCVVVVVVGRSGTGVGSGSSSECRLVGCSKDAKGSEDRETCGEHREKGGRTVEINYWMKARWRA